MSQLINILKDSGVSVRFSRNLVIVQFQEKEYPFYSRSSACSFIQRIVEAVSPDLSQEPLENGDLIALM